MTFNAITKSAVTEAMEHPRALDEDLIDAYRARRALDYLVGFTLSPVLWRKLPGAKSAGRVQSVALRLIVDREREIELFRAQEYWSVTATLEADGTEFAARLVRYNGDKIDRLTIGEEGTALAAKKAVEEGRFSVVSVETKPLTRNPPPPFTTSTLQQEAARKLGFSASQTMRLAQSLYEDGAITYMRTDGVQMAPEAISAARKAVADRYDAGYVPDRPRHYETKAKNAQEAHEAIRPTDFARDHAGSGDHARLYELIWKRALASQMASARLERTTAELADGTGQHALRATGQVVLFPGFLALYEEGRDDAEDEDSAPPAAPARRRHAGEEEGRRRAAFHPAAAALFRSEPGQEDGGARHRPPLHLRRDPADAEGPRLCPAGEEPLPSGGERAAADRLPRALLRALRLLRFHRPSRGRAGRYFRRAGASGRRCSRNSGATSSRRPPR